jgi:hypothetical protein
MLDLPRSDDDLLRPGSGLAVEEAGGREEQRPEQEEVEKGFAEEGLHVRMELSR